jgi:hypothetical protein
MQPLKKAKIEDSRNGFGFTFDATHFVIPAVSHTVPPVQPQEPAWTSDPRYAHLSLYLPRTAERVTVSSGQSEDNGEVKSEDSSDESSDSEGTTLSVQGGPVMAEVIDLPEQEFYTPGDKVPVEASSAMLRKLSASKSPIMEALIYCAFNGWGVEIVKQGPEGDWVPDLEFGLTSKSGVIAFKFSDFDLLSDCLERVNSKNKPTTDPGARIKALKRWFDGIPCVRNRNDQFVATVKRTEQLSKVKDMIRRMLKIYKKRLDQSKVGKGDNDAETPSAYEPLDSASSVSSEHVNSPY